MILWYFFFVSYDPVMIYIFPLFLRIIMSSTVTVIITIAVFLIIINIITICVVIF